MGSRRATGIGGRWFFIPIEHQKTTIEEERAAGRNAANPASPEPRDERGGGGQLDGYDQSGKVWRGGEGFFDRRSGEKWGPEL